MNEDDVLERLKNLVLENTSPEERTKILEEASRVIQAEQTVECKYTIEDPWQRQLFIEVVHSFGLKPFRKGRQRKSTFMVRGQQALLEDQLWPRFEELSEELSSLLAETASSFICGKLHKPGAGCEDGEHQAQP